MNKVLKKIIEIDSKPVPRKVELIFCGFGFLALLFIWVLFFVGEYKDPSTDGSIKWGSIQDVKAMKNE